MAPKGASIEPGELPEIRLIWRAYLAGDVMALDRVPVRQTGSPVQVAVWDALREVKPGQPVTYGEMALLIGRPRAARAVGSACATNRVAPFVPCHRVVAANGRPGGYGYGLPVKQWLLDHEADSAGA
jgi:methylated-DNA-[protein]-cysteine S-methyltransferase